MAGSVIGDRVGPTTLTYRDRPIGDILSGAAAAYSMRPATIDGEDETSYAALYRFALKFANALRDHGVSVGYRVALILPNSTEFVAAYYGALPDTEIQIQGPNGEGALPVGERSEVWVNGPQVCAGYVSGDADGFTAGWLRAGDIWALASEGFVHLYDQQKDMLICKGCNVYPGELEEVIGNFPGVLSVAVVGRPDERVGEKAVAFVVARQGSQLAADVLTDHVARRVVPNKRLCAVFFVDELPTTPAGKILKHELRTRFADLVGSTQTETR
ncbi:class I adenylate-forming enzyme family protein [Mycolicibacterium austroafricanum]|uniref:class I adenylate-forming enzyme family protein n=1 Tax=Mycolicibacterium austroafricanum TaxID=39687 RepID=UPI001CA3357B|nr:AMP-binding protein [Mycolicibacterium austroafricanum]QZT58568.1 AMP-binding protein [Mycolicibacterium austroafricanum]